MRMATNRPQCVGISEDCILERLENVSNSTALLYGESEDSMRLITAAGRRLIIAAYGLLFFVGTTANLAICGAVTLKKSLRTGTNVMIANLAVGDLMMNIPLVMTPMQALLGDWLWGELMCRIFNSVSVMSVFVSSLTLAVMAVYRYITILHVCDCRIMTRYSVVKCVAIWLIATVVTIPTMINTEVFKVGAGAICTDLWNYSHKAVYTMVLLFAQFVMPSLVMLFCHLRIHRRLTVRFKTVSALVRSAKTAQKLKVIARRRRIHRVLVVMVLAYIISWLPLNAFNITLDYSPDLAAWAYAMPVFFCVHYVAMASTVFNPLLYAICNPEFRRRLKRPRSSSSERFHTKRAPANSQNEEPWCPEEPCTRNTSRL